MIDRNCGLCYTSCMRSECSEYLVNNTNPEAVSVALFRGASQTGMAFRLVLFKRWL